MPTLFDDMTADLDHAIREWLAHVDINRAARRISPWLRRKTPDDTIRVAEWLRVGWQGLYHDCRLLNDARLEAVARVLSEEVTPDEIRWAIRAYHRECTTSEGRLKSPGMRRSFESFMATSIVEYWALQGRGMAAKDAEHKQAAAERGRRRVDETHFTRLAGAFRALSDEEKQEYYRQAVRQLELAHHNLLLAGGGASAGNPHVRAKALELFQADRARQRDDVTPAVARPEKTAAQEGRR
ncbi:MAG TPA: hypothetical protein VMW52_05335 [Phycisphaerae bacterium]|nr:hypothetical protein [Phycisphaerae bacterium]